MQYPGKRISSFSPTLASPFVCISLLVGAIVISRFLTRPIDAARPVISGSGQIPDSSAKLVGKRLQRRDYPEIAKALKKYDLVRLGRAELKSQMQKNGRLLLKTSAGDFDLELTPHELRSQDYQSQMIGADGIAWRLPITPVKTYKGPVNGSSRAQARMMLTEQYTYFARRVRRENASPRLVVTSSRRSSWKLPPGQEFRLRLSLHGLSSNKARLAIR